ncbi:MAG: RidA family protein [Alphaproteobacteria bacterium]
MAKATKAKAAKKPAAPKRTLITLSEGEKTYAMSRALVQGDWCFVSGTVGYDYTKGELPDSAAQQAHNTFTNIQSALKAAGFELGHTVRVQYTVSDREHIETVLPIIRQHFGAILPAATMIIAGMVDPKMKIEIEVTAFKG